MIDRTPNHFDTLTRPLAYARIRIDEFAAAKWLEDLLRAERDDLVEELTIARGKKEDTSRLEKELRWCSRLIAGAAKATEDLAGKVDEDDSQ